MLFRQGWQGRLGQIIGIVWLFWGESKALASFTAVAVAWADVVVVSHGFDPYLAYLRTIDQTLWFPYPDCWLYNSNL